MADLTVLGLAGSPRRDGNTRILLDRVLEGARHRGAAVVFVDLCRLDIAPCIACDGCWEHEGCVVQDDYQSVYERLVAADRIVLASPIYFMGLTAQAKNFVDRAQCLWALKYVQRKTIPAPSGGGARYGHLISVGGAGFRDLFSCAERTFRAFLDALGARVGDHLLFSRVDERGAIRAHPTALAEAYALGERMVSD